MLIKKFTNKKLHRYLAGMKKNKYYLNNNNKYTEYTQYIQYFKAWNASFNYKCLNLDMINKNGFDCVPNALFKTYGTKMEISNSYLHSVHKGDLDYVSLL
jgi:hypothetical protein